MTETKRRIKELKAALPRAREKIVAVALMLAMSVAMMASVSYAWYTMSFAPEASGITTQVSSNGSLEVALAGRYDADGNLLEPGTSGVDSFSAEDQTTVKANLTWGNLINLSTNYGIENLVLRPATLDLVGSSSFLSSKHYGEDGRVEGSATDFGFTKWGIKDEQLGTYDFVYKNSQYYGVRAISSLIYPDGKGELETKLSILDEMYADVVSEYNRICRGESKDYPDVNYIDTIQAIVQTYLSANVEVALGDGTAEVTDVDCTSFVDELYVMLYDFYDNAVCAYGDLLAYMATIQTGIAYTGKTLDQVDVDDVELAGLSMYMDLKVEMDEACEKMDDVYKRKHQDETITWGDLEDIIYILISVNTADITMAGKTQTVGRWMNDKTYLVSNIFDVSGSDVPVTIHDGAFWKFERLSGASMFVEFDLYVKYGLTITFTAQLYTDAATKGQPYYAIDKVNTQNKGGTVSPSNKVAADTYGMVLDLWVRTNAADSILTLDGLAKYTETKVERYIQIIVYDENGTSSTESRQVYFYNTYTTENIEGMDVEVETEHLVYPDVDTDDIDGDGDTAETIYRDTVTRTVAYLTETDTNGEETSRLLTSSDVEVKYDIEISVDGFESSNRVDGSYEGMLFEGEISTTQGSGSCYIFYSSNPEEAANTLKMLSYLRLAFVDSNNSWLADAKLDVEFAYPDNGKYIVPIVITKSNCTYTAKDGAGKDASFYGITNLEQNEATMISVIVYLEGDGVDNSMVLSGETVSGTLNIQFASTADLEAMFNTDLSTQYLSLSAKINGELLATYEYNGTAHRAELIANIEGIGTNASVKAIFRRKINATQGSTMDAITLEYNADKGWVGYPEFTMPGDYVLNGLWIDGVEYNFPTVDGISSEIKVTVSGFALQSVTMYGSAMAFTADSYTTREVGVQFSVDKALQPSTVSGRFLSDTGEYITVPMYWTGTEWKGTATFRNSGTYTLTYLVLDGEYYELDAQYQRSLIAYLGLYAEVSLVYPLPTVSDGTAAVGETGDDGSTDETETVTSKVYRNSNLTFIYEQATSVGVMVNVYSNTGEKMEGLENLYLIYADQRNPSFPEMGLNTRLIWNGEYYTGTFPVESAGFYYFAYVKVGNEEHIQKAVQSPTINAAYPDPPAYDSSDTPELTITGNNYNSSTEVTTYPEAIYQATIKYGPGYTNVVAIFENEAGDRVTATAYGTGKSTKGSDYTVYYFKFPVVQSTSTGVADSQNGTWKVVGFEFYDVYDDDNVYHAAKDEENSNPYVVGIAEDQQKTYYVVNVVTIDVNAATLGVSKDESGNDVVTGTFMQEYTYADLSGITITPAATNSVLQYADITEMTLTLTQNNDSSTHGGYSFGEGYVWGGTGYETSYFILRDPDEDGTFTVVSAKSEDENSTICLAGTYQYTLVVKTATGATYTFAGSNLLTVKSVKPTAVITTGTTTWNAFTKITYTTDWKGTPTFTGLETIQSNYDSYTATLYAKAVIDNATVITNAHGYFYEPTLCIAVSGIGSGTTATLTLPAGNGLAAKVFSYDTDEAVSHELGLVETYKSFGIGGRHYLEKYTGYGTNVQITTMAVVKNGVTFNITLDNPLTINNPSSVNQS